MELGIPGITRATLVSRGANSTVYNASRNDEQVRVRIVSDHDHDRSVELAEAVAHGGTQHALRSHAGLLPILATGLTAKQQRQIANSIKRARQIALLPYVKRD